MFEGMLFYIFVCLAFFAIGDFLGVATKAKVSSVFVSLLLFLIFFMADWIPDDVINQAGLTQIGKWAVGFVVFGMGTTINMRELMAEWRTVATACLSMAVIWIGMIVLVPLIGYNETIVAIPIINGGIVATQIMTSAAMENGLEMAAALGTILYAVQKFFGTPFASYFGLREAREVLAVYRQTGVNPNKAQPKAGEEPKLTFFDKHKKYYGQFVCLGITAFFSWVAWCIGQLVLCRKTFLLKPSRAVSLTLPCSLPSSRVWPRLNWAISSCWATARLSSLSLSLFCFMSASVFCRFGKFKVTKTSPWVWPLLSFWASRLPT